MDKKPVVELPRLENESAARYQARTRYILAGPDRSLERVSRELAKSLPLMKRWSTEDDWPRHAADYDQTVYTLAAQRQTDEYLDALADYRKRYGEMGKALYMSAAKLVKKINAMLDTVDQVNPGSLVTAMNAAKTAADLEALALRVEHLLNDEPGRE